MSDDKIAKLRELAERGVEGEKENAKRILTKAGIDWRKPKESIIDRVKSTVGMDITKQYKFPIKSSSDLLFLAIIISERTKSNTLRIDGTDAIITCTPAECKDVNAIFSKHKQTFSKKIIKDAFAFYNNIV